MRSAEAAKTPFRCNIHQHALTTPPGPIPSPHRRCHQRIPMAFAAVPGRASREIVREPNRHAGTRVVPLRLRLPAVPPPVARKHRCRRAGDLLFPSGKGQRRVDTGSPERTMRTGVSVAETKTHAPLIGSQGFAIMRCALDALDRVACVVKLRGMVNTEPRVPRLPGRDRSPFGALRNGFRRERATGSLVPRHGVLAARVRRRG